MQPSMGSQNNLTIQTAGKKKPATKAVKPSALSLAQMKKLDAKFDKKLGDKA